MKKNLLLFALVILIAACNPCKRASRMIIKAEIICPTIVSRDSQDVMFNIPSLDAQIAVERNDTLLELMTRHFAIQLKAENTDTGRYRVIERFIHENCLERDTTNFVFEDGTVKLFLTDGKINVALHVNDKQAQVRAPLKQFNPTVIDNSNAWIFGIISLCLLGIIVLILIRKKDSNI